MQYIFVFVDILHGIISVSAYTEMCRAFYQDKPEVFDLDYSYKDFNNTQHFYSIYGKVSD